MDLWCVGSFDSEFAKHNKFVWLRGPVQFGYRSINALVQNLADEVEPVLVAECLEFSFIYLLQSFDNAEALSGFPNLEVFLSSRYLYRIVHLFSNTGMFLSQCVKNEYFLIWQSFCTVKVAFLENLREQTKLCEECSVDSIIVCD